MSGLLYIVSVSVLACIQNVALRREHSNCLIIGNKEIMAARFAPKRDDNNFRHVQRQKKYFTVTFVISLCSQQASFGIIRLQVLPDSSNHCWIFLIIGRVLQKDATQPVHHSVPATDK